MKQVILLPKARDDRRNAVRWYRDNAGTTVAEHLIVAMEADLEHLQCNPEIGSPTIGDQLEINNLRAWAVSGFPLTIFYFVREDRLDVVRILGQRQDIATILTSDA